MKVVRCLFTLVICIGLFFTPAQSATGSLRVVFLNPGMSDPNSQSGGFWRSVSEFMEAAANDLGIELETMYSERDRLLMIDQASEVISRSTPPDCLVVVNEMLGAQKIVQDANKAGIQVFLLLNGFYGQQEIEMGSPRDKYKYWIGSLIPDNKWAGYQVANKLIETAKQRGVSAKDGRFHLVALAGDLVTPASVERSEGLRQAVSEHPEVVLNQIVAVNWRKDVAQERSFGLLKRYPETSIIWAANDPIALGALEAAIELGKRPGRDVFIGGLNWDVPALDKIKEGSLTTSAGGHFMAGGWALVMLYDYYNGRDFIEQGALLKITIFDMLSQDSPESFLNMFCDRDWKQIDFTRFSKVLNPNVNAYDFSVGAIMNNRKGPDRQ